MLKSEHSVLPHPLSVTVDKCLKCSKDADCVNGACICKPGFSGDGTTCTPTTNPEGE